VRRWHKIVASAAMSAMIPGLTSIMGTLGSGIEITSQVMYMTLGGMALAFLKDIQSFIAQPPEND
jgi:hypothetical protein